MDEADVVSIAELLDERRYLLDVACWMLGSADEAECVVDEVYRRWYGLSGAARREIARPRSWLARSAGRSCLSRLAPVERSDDTALEAGPEEVEAGVEVSRVLLEAPGCLSPDERARASLRVRRSDPVAPWEHDALVRAVGRACLDGDAEHLVSLLCPDVTAFFDGGGKVRALSRPVQGGRQVAHSLLTLLARRSRTALTAQSVNGRTGLVARYGRQVAAIISLDVADHRVIQVWVILNPDKLRSWNQP
ncbi:MULTISPECIES: RNA polymerase subunit sigma [unclassified Streptomyces]|uniref:RNA polymerase subunit sigma n=1 Tax=unclassified Streptomyces TaxID=2593676 RepID=UPI0011625B2E|nr:MULTISPECIES: RNA polymerase subunit sigma [unclassified Streptomyces]NMI62614.1 RNA polymerase subunit sigma [Streptomyces sp. RLA2-12]QDN61598.1 RNA polymerase subunit sigma [Streptomyces sp. S1D4-20]QDN71651.1 RNA polymerase subunit sigma [Streptomyces sp. S1D4-14]QDO54108.1 RNA polymerase subunit sigma [Streptomyces sp. RLB3-5]QDO64353.1 RNA polymerase subunit sigma [Streptomyces sp. RLB1-8]